MFLRFSIVSRQHEKLLKIHLQIVHSPTFGKQARDLFNNCLRFYYRRRNLDELGRIPTKTVSRTETILAGRFFAGRFLTKLKRSTAELVAKNRRGMHLRGRTKDRFRDRHFSACARKWYLFFRRGPRSTFHSVYGHVCVRARCATLSQDRANGREKRKGKRRKERKKRNASAER